MNRIIVGLMVVVVAVFAGVIFFKFKSHKAAPPTALDTRGAQVEAKAPISSCEAQYHDILAKESCSQMARAYVAAMAHLKKPECGNTYFAARNSTRKHTHSEEQHYLMDAIFPVADCYLEKDQVEDLDLSRAFDAALKEKWNVDLVRVDVESEVLILQHREWVEKKFNPCRSLREYIRAVREVVQPGRILQLVELPLTEHTFNVGSMNSDDFVPMSVTKFAEALKKFGTPKFTVDKGTGAFKFNDFPSDGHALFLQTMREGSCVYLEGAYSGIQSDELHN